MISHLVEGGATMTSTPRLKNIMYGEEALLKICNFCLYELIEKAETQPNLTIGVLISVVIVVLSLSLFFKLIFGGAKVNVEKKNPETATETSTSEAKAEEKEETAAAPRNRQRRES